MDYECYSDFLFAEPSLIEGVARIVDIGSTLNEYNKSDTPDIISLRMDWEAVGSSLREAIKQYDQEQKEKFTVR